MEYLVVAYLLIGSILTAYTVSVRQRCQSVQRERELLESKKD